MVTASDDRTIRIDVPWFRPATHLTPRLVSATRLFLFDGPDPSRQDASPLLLSVRRSHPAAGARRLMARARDRVAPLSFLPGLLFLASLAAGDGSPEPFLQTLTGGGVPSAMVLPLVLSYANSSRRSNVGRRFGRRQLQREDPSTATARMRLYDDLLTNGWGFLDSLEKISQILLLRSLNRFFAFFFLVQILHDAPLYRNATSKIRTDRWFGEHRHIRSLLLLWAMWQSSGKQLLQSLWLELNGYSLFFFFCLIGYEGFLLMRVMYINQTSFFPSFFWLI